MKYSAIQVQQGDQWLYIGFGSPSFLPTNSCWLPADRATFWLDAFQNANPSKKFRIVEQEAR